MSSTYHVTGSVLLLPAPAPEILAADLLARLYRRCCEQRSALRYPGSAHDWRWAADLAKDDVARLRRLAHA